MGCSACARRRARLEAKREQKQAQGKQIQAAALGAVLAVTETVGKAIGASGEVQNDGMGREDQEGGGRPEPSAD